MERRIPMNRQRGNPRAGIPVDKSADSVPAWLSGKRVRSGKMSLLVRPRCDLLRKRVGTQICILDNWSFLFYTYSMKTTFLAAQYFSRGFGKILFSS